MQHPKFDAKNHTGENSLFISAIAMYCDSMMSPSLVIADMIFTMHGAKGYPITHKLTHFQLLVQFDS